MGAGSLAAVEGLPRRLLLVLALAGLAAGVAGCGSDSVDARLTEPGPVQEGGGLPSGSPETGKRLPDDTYERLEGGEATFAQYRGKPVVVNVWASWCAPCLQEMPAIEEVHGELGDQITFVGINSRDDRGEAKSVAARTGVTYDLLFDPKAGFVADTGVLAFPTTLFVDAEGRIVSSKAGPIDADGLRSRLAEAFGTTP